MYYVLRNVYCTCRYTYYIYRKIYYVLRNVYYICRYTYYIYRYIYYALRINVYSTCRNIYYVLGIFKKNSPYKKTGVKEVSPLRWLPLFDLIWDILPDLMHIITGIWKRHFLDMLKGNRKPAQAKQRKSWTKEENAKLEADHKKCLEELQTWTLTKEEGATLDARSRSLGGESTWIRSNLEVYSHGGVLTAHDWMQLVQCAGVYLFANLLPNDERRMDAACSLLRACNKILTLTSAFNSENREVIDQLKLEVTEALCEIESVIPKTELAVMFHILLHVPDCMYRWNSVRNFWSFFGERAMGYFIRFINNRDLAAENIMTAYCRLRLMLDSHPGIVMCISKFDS